MTRIMAAPPIFILPFRTPMYDARYGSPVHAKSIPDGSQQDQQKKKKERKTKFHQPNKL